MNNFFLWFFTMVNSIGMMTCFYTISLVGRGTNEKIKALQPDLRGFEEAPRSGPRRTTAPPTATFEEVKRYLDNYRSAKNCGTEEQESGQTDEPNA